ncbi:MAG: tetratricopeptide repeat protein, partial [Opitutaceae bacterium]
MDPFHLYALQLAGLAAGQLGLLDQAVAFFRRALRIDPKSGATHINLGSVYADFGRDTDAEKSLKAGLALTPGDPEAWLRIGIYNLSRGRTAEAMGCCTEALKLKPGFPAAFKVIGDIRKGEGEAVQAAAFYRVALKSAPENTEARLGLVQTLLSCNRVAESISECDRILAAHPRDIQARSHRLFLLNYLEDLPVRELFAEHQKYGILFPAAPRRSFPNPRDPAKRIRVAFLSRDLRAHAVAFFLEPIVANLDPAQFEVVLYHDHMKVDEVSERFRSRAALWRNFCGRPDAVVEGAIRADAPDVLFDLAGHTGQNRLHLFARRLAPVQVNYLGYPNTTGLPAMDCRFSDEVADPPGDADCAHAERLVRFSSCAWAYMPPAAVGGAFDGEPAGGGETVSFGSFSNFSKVNDATLRLWAGVLAAVPGSRLVLKSPWIDGESLARRLVQVGIEPGRVTLLKPLVDPIAHLNCYRNVDIALDPFPYGGTTTTCEALWMGRPVVTLAG